MSVQVRPVVKAGRFLGRTVPKILCVLSPFVLETFGLQTVVSAVERGHAKKFYFSVRWNSFSLRHSESCRQLQCYLILRRMQIRATRTETAYRGMPANH
jgi:hypothetical protein